MGKFEDQLLDDLMREHGPALAGAQRPAPRRTRRTVWIAAGAVALASVMTLGLTLINGGPQAFAVTRNADGSVTVTIKDIAAVDPLNEEMERLGIPIRAIRMSHDCAGIPGSDHNVRYPPEEMPTFYLDSIVVPAKALHRSQIHLFGVREVRYPDGSMFRSESYASIKAGDPIPGCATLGGPVKLPAPSK